MRQPQRSTLGAVHAAIICANGRFLDLPSAVLRQPSPHGKRQDGSISNGKRDLVGSWSTEIDSVSHPRLHQRGRKPHQDDNTVRWQPSRYYPATRAAYGLRYVLPVPAAGLHPLGPPRHVPQDLRRTPSAALQRERLQVRQRDHLRVRLSRHQRTCCCPGSASRCGGCASTSGTQTSPGRSAS
jgi:hypothetical protein